MENEITPRPVGRPTKYRDEYCRMAELVIKKAGFNIATLAQLFNVNEDTIYEWRQVHPDFSEVIETTKREYLKSIAGQALAKRIQGYEYEEVSETVSEKHGRSVTVTKKHVHPSDASIIFALCNTDADNFRNQQYNKNEHRIDSDLIGRLTAAKKRLKDGKNDTE